MGIFMEQTLKEKEFEAIETGSNTHWSPVTIWLASLCF
jgi:hypothetical protein